MRMIQKRLKTYYFRNRIVVKDNEGVSVNTFGDALPVAGEVWPAKSERQVEQYGDRISGIQNVRVQGAYTIVVDNGCERIRFTDFGFTLALGDGMCLYVGPEEEPDYQVLSFTQYEPLLIEVERRRNG